jgi:alpha-L-fucosidase
MEFTRRSVLAGAGALGAVSAQEAGAQRLSLTKLQGWEALGYGMFIHFGMSTFVGRELPDGRSPASLYQPDRLDVDQWIQVARDAGMKYAVLTAKHVAGHCLWPSRHTDYTVSKSGQTADVVEAFVRACRRRGLLPGLYYCSWDNHHLFGSLTPSFRQKSERAFTTSLYQSFQTAQISELLTEYGPIAEMWIDIPEVLGRGYRTFLYQHIARLQPDCAIMMNSGISDQATYNVERNWPSDLIAIERRLPPPGGHIKWRDIEGKRCYLPGEVCDTLGKEWFWREADRPRPDEELAGIYRESRRRGVNLLLDVGPDRRGLVTDECRDALFRLRKNAGL